MTIKKCVYDSKITLILLPANPRVPGPPGLVDDKKPGHLGSPKPARAAPCPDCVDKSLTIMAYWQIRLFEEWI
jgi:hypothetical protein